MQLTVYISSAADGLLTVKTTQVPELSVLARTLEDIPDAVCAAAAALTGRTAEDFVVVMDF